MTKKRLILFCLALLVLIAACATGPSYQQAVTGFPSLGPDRARVFFYRNFSPFGAAIQPVIKLDGQPVGSSVSGGFFFVDVKPGQHKAESTTEATEEVTFSARAGQVIYIRTYISMGILVGRIYLEEVTQAEGAREVKELNYQAPEKPAIN